MSTILNNGFFQVLGVVITALVAWGAAKFTRSSSKEANQTVGWTNLVTVLQSEVKELHKEEDETRKYVKELDQGNKELARRVYVLERSRHRWKGWGQRVAEIMRARGVDFPEPPEPLHDTDPGMETIQS